MHPNHLAMGNAEMIHISGATYDSAGDSSHIMMVLKESKNSLGTLATRRGLYSATAAEGFERINIWKS